MDIVIVAVTKKQRQPKELTQIMDIKKEFQENLLLGTILDLIKAGR